MKFEGFNNGDLAFLPPEDRAAVLRDMSEIVECNSSLRIGQLLCGLRRTLSVYGYFLRAIKAVGLAERTAYGYMYGYNNAVATLPAGAVQAMIDRKLTINAYYPKRESNLGEWTKLVAELPPPKKGSAEAYAKWVDELIALKPLRRGAGQVGNRVIKDPEEFIEDCYRRVEIGIKRLPHDPKVRERAAKKLIGLIMRRFDLAAGKFSPVEVPSSLIPSRRIPPYAAVA
jgi:hypothetical protein